MKREIIGLMIGAAGLGLVAWSAGWIAALGVFLALGGNNVEQTARGDR